MGIWEKMVGKEDYFSQRISSNLARDSTKSKRQKA